MVVTVKCSHHFFLDLIAGNGILWKVEEEVITLLTEDILKGESKNIEYKIVLPEKSDKYLKSVVAFANTSGGKIVIGIEDREKKIVGVDEKCVSNYGPDS